jgi:cytochrome P450
LEAMDASAAAIQKAAAVPFLNRAIGRHLPGKIGESFRKWDIWQSLTAELLSEFRREEVDSDKSMRFMATPLLMNEDSHLGRKLTEMELFEELMGLTFAGSGTTSTTLTYLIYALSRDPVRQERLRQELNTVGDGINEVKNLPFLNAVIKETMRLYPTIMSTLSQVLDRDLVVDKLLLPPGTRAGMQNYVHHRDASLFSGPDDFLPERWLGESPLLKDMEAAFTPFSLGPHNCIGQNLARAELYLAASQIFKKLKIRLSSQMLESDMEMEDRFNIAPKGKRLLVDVIVI